MAFVSAYAFVCQNTLTEHDGVTSAIRIVEIFYLPNLPEEERIKLPPVAMSLYANIRLTADDSDPHTLNLLLVRPDGERHKISVFENRPVQEPKVPILDRTINATGQIAVEPRQLGRHEFIVEFDGKTVASAYFTLVDAQSPNARELQFAQPVNSPN